MTDSERRKILKGAVRKGEPQVRAMAQTQLRLLDRIANLLMAMYDTENLIARKVNEPKINDLLRQKLIRAMLEDDRAQDF